jgi:hypothetical protein
MSQWLPWFTACTTVQSQYDNARIMGILGQNFLEHFNLVINNRTSCIRLFEGYNPY